jgi:hypothetical protein
MEDKTMIKLLGHVKNWLKDMNEQEYTEALDDLLSHGCQSGMVSDLIYYKDTVKFYDDHQGEIDSMLSDLCDDLGCSPAELFGNKWDDSDPLARDTHNKNLLAWFGFEETARTLSDE